MSAIIRYFIAASTDRDLLDLRSTVAGYSTANQNPVVVGSSSVNVVWAAPGVDLDVRNLLGGQDVVFFNRNWADYSKDLTSVSGAIVFSYLDSNTGLTERVTVLNGSTTNGQDNLVFADGSVITNNARSALQTSLSAAITDVSASNLGETSTNPGGLVPSTAGGTLRGFGSVTTGSTEGASFGMTQPGVTTILVGSSLVDKAYVNAYSIVDARNLLGGEDIIYFTGNWGSYTKSLTAVSGAIVFERTVNAMTERVTVLNGSTTNGQDKLVFTDGAVITNNARSALQTSLSAAITAVTDYDLATTTPLPGPTVTISADDTALKAGETATITFTLSEAATDFTADDVTVSAGALTSFSGSGTTYTATFTPPGSTDASTVTIGVAAETFTNAAAQNNSAGSLELAVDTNAPTLAITSNVSAVKVGETAAITFTFSEEPAGFAAGDVTTTGGTLSDPVVTADLKVYTATFTPTAGFEGNASITVASGAYTDAATNTGGAGTTPAISIDTLAPAAATFDAVATDDIINATEQTATVTVSGTNEAGATVTLNGNAVTANTATTWNYDLSAGAITAFGEGAETLTVVSTDAAGNATISTKAITVDTIAPTITAQAASVGTKTLTLTMSEAVTGTPAASDFAVLTNSAANTVTAVSASGTTVTLTLTNTIPNNATMTVDYTQGTSTLTDGAGNALASVGDAVSVTVTNDTTVPTVLSFGSSTGDGAYKADDTINITATMSEAVQSGSTFNVTLDTNDTITLTAASAGTTLSGTYTVGAGDNSTDLTVSSFTTGTVTDFAGNAMGSTTLPAGQNLANNKAIVIDTIAPIDGWDNGTLTQNDGNGTADAGDYLAFLFSEAIGNKATLEAFFNTSDTYGAAGTRAGVAWSNADRTLTVTLGAGETYDAATAIQLVGVQDIVGNSSTLNFTFVI